ncbi:MAG: nickel pincer cofactor biosynthesis protein LarB [Bacillota bacterium]|nr:nickel pincer cofactor biosynthesis protein LarB [Bacillota bacterium]
MERATLAELLGALYEHRLSVEEALERLQFLPYLELDFARPDTHRGIRCGFGEVIYGGGKTPEQVAAIARGLAAAGGNVLVTRATREQGEAVAGVLPGAVFHPVPRLITFRQAPAPQRLGTVAVLSAGTADLPVAEEAAVVAEFFGNPVLRLYDVGVAGLHRLLDHLPALSRAQAVIVVAGMDGALASVVGGLIPRPVIAVPTSAGYGAGAGGYAALLSMLNSCAAGVGVLNIDNGFGAACLATRINTPVVEPVEGAGSP